METLAPAVEERSLTTGPPWKSRCFFFPEILVNNFPYKDDCFHVLNNRAFRLSCSFYLCTGVEKISSMSFPIPSVPSIKERWLSTLHKTIFKFFSFYKFTPLSADYRNTVLISTWQQGTLALLRTGKRFPLPPGHSDTDMCLKIAQPIF